MNSLMYIFSTCDIPGPMLDCGDSKMDETGLLLDSYSCLSGWQKTLQVLTPFTHMKVRRYQGPEKAWPFPGAGDT